MPKNLPRSLIQIMAPYRFRMGWVLIENRWFYSTTLPIQLFFLLWFFVSEEGTSHVFGSCGAVTKLRPSLRPHHSPSTLGIGNPFWLINSMVGPDIVLLRLLFASSTGWTSHLVGGAMEAFFFRLLLLFSVPFSACAQCSGRFLGITGWDPGVCKSNRLHVHILRFPFIKLEYILYIPLEWSVIFLQSWTWSSTSYFSYSTGSSVTNCRFFPIIAFAPFLLWEEPSGWAALIVLFTSSLVSSYFLPPPTPSHKKILPNTRVYLSMALLLRFNFHVVF